MNFTHPKEGQLIADSERPVSNAFPFSRNNFTSSSVRNRHGKFNSINMDSSSLDFLPLIKEKDYRNINNSFNKQFKQQSTRRPKLIVDQKIEMNKEFSMGNMLIPNETVIAQIDHALHVPLDYINKNNKLNGSNNTDENNHSECFEPLCEARVKDMTENQSTNGILFCTNFRLLFISEKGVPNNIQINNINYWRKSIRYFSIPVGNIHSIYNILSNGDNKLITHQYKASRNIEEIYIRCKNCQKVKLSFYESMPSQVKRFIQSIVFHSFPSSVEKHVAVDIGKSWDNSQSSNGEMKVPSYEDEYSWENTIQKMKLDNWRVTAVNSNFKLSSSLPPYFVVPRIASDIHLLEMAEMYEDGRLPILSYATDYGILLFRSAAFKQEYQYGSNSNQLYDAENDYISSCCTADSMITLGNMIIGDFDKVDLTQRIPTCKEILSSYQKMMDAVNNCHQSCIGAVVNTRWLDLVKSCLVLSIEVVNKLHNQMKCVLLQETNGRDMTALISTLVQLMADPDTRTLIGFESLIQREWVAYGHPFSTRFKHKLSILPTQELVEANISITPVFFLLLDCVWQMMRQYPTWFEFNSQFLIMMTHEVTSCISSTFLFDSIKDKQDTLENLKNTFSVSRLFTFWEMRRQIYPTELTENSLNPLYCLRQSLMNNIDMLSLLDECLEDYSKHHYRANTIIHSSTTSPNKIPNLRGSISTSLISRPKVSFKTHPSSLFKPMTTIIIPELDNPFIQIWKEFFFNSMWDVNSDKTDHVLEAERQMQNMVKTIFNLYHEITEYQSNLNASSFHIDISPISKDRRKISISPIRENFFDNMKPGLRNSLTHGANKRKSGISIENSLERSQTSDTVHIVNDNNLFGNKNEKRPQLMEQYNKLSITELSECIEAITKIDTEGILHLECLNMNVISEEKGDL